jgi:hypothetical protein
MVRSQIRVFFMREGRVAGLGKSAVNRSPLCCRARRIRQNSVESAAAEFCLKQNRNHNKAAKSGAKGRHKRRRISGRTRSLLSPSRAGIITNSKKGKTKKKSAAKRRQNGGESPAKTIAGAAESLEPNSCVF